MPSKRREEHIQMKERKQKEVNLPDYKPPKHTCTDILCAIIFAVFLIALILLSILAYINGDPSSLVLPHDSQGRICGKTKGLEDKKFLLFFDLTKCLSFISAINGCPTPQVCVTECPNTYAYDKIPSDRDKIKQFCDPNNSTICPKYLLKSLPLYGRCVPEIVANITENLQEAIQVFDPSTNKTIPIQAFDENGLISDLSIGTLKKAAEYLKNLLNLKETYQLIFEDFSKTYGLILIGIFLAAILALIWVFLLRFIIKPVVYFSILGVLSISAFVTFFSTREFLTLNKNQTDFFKLEYNKLYDVTYVKNLKEFWLVLAIIFGVIFLILFLIIVFLRKRIKLAIEMIREVSKAVIDIPTLLIWPILPLILQVGVIVYCVSISLYLASSGIQLFKIVDTGDSFINSTYRQVTELNIGDYCTPDNFQELKKKLNNPLYDSYECYFYKFGFNTTLPVGIESENVRKYFTLGVELINKHQWIPQAFVLFMLFWLTTFTIGLNEMTLAGAFGTWYFTRYGKFKLKDLPLMTIISSFTRALFYHVGTLAFGSLLIAIIKMIRVFLEYLNSKVKDTESKIGKFIMKCMKCCFYCLEKIVKFINRRAYIMTATYSLNFCSAVKKSLKIITSNVIRVAVVNKITDFVLFLSNLCITFSVAVLGFYFFTGKIPIDALTSLIPQLNFYVVPLLIVIIGSYCVNRLFFDVFAFGVDTILMCALIDIDENDGTSSRPYYMSTALQNILNGKKHN